MRRRMFVGLAFVAAAATVATALAAGSSAGSRKSFTLGYVPPTVAPFETAMRQGIKLQAKALGMNVIVAGGQFDPNVQLTAVDSLVQRHVDAILIWPIDENGIAPAFDRAKAAHIPIFVIDSPDARDYTTNFQTDDYAAGVKLAKVAAAQAAKPCAVGVIQGLPVVPILKARNSGLEAGAKAAGCTVLDRQVNTTDNVVKARDIVTAWRTKYGSKMNVVLAVNDPSALAALSAGTSSFHPVLTGYNGDAANIEQIKKGTIAATAALLSPEIGNGLAYAAYQTLSGHAVPRTVSSPYSIVTKANVGAYKSYAGRLHAAMKVSFVKSSGGHVLVTALG